MEPGDEIYDDLLEQNTGDHDKTRTDKDELKRLWSRYVDDLQDEVFKHADELKSRGFKDADAEGKKRMREMVKRCEMDPEEQKSRKKATAVLDAIRPVVRVDGEVSSLRQLGADGLLASDLDKTPEWAAVEVLDATAKLKENDREPDEWRVYNEHDDLDEAAKGKKFKTGAMWVDGGYRLGPGLSTKLKTYQIDCLRFVVERLANNSGALIAHAMGLGKSLTLLASLEAYGSRSKSSLKAVLTCPKSVVSNWQMEFCKWQDFLTLNAFFVDGSQTSLFQAHSLNSWDKNGGVLVVAHDHFKNLVQNGKVTTDEETVVAVDEAHKTKTQGTEKYDMLDSLPTRKRILMTGTPMQNNLNEYYFMTQLIQPGLLGDTSKAFKQLYGNIIEKGMQKNSSDDDIRMSERTVHVMRLKAAEVMHDQSASVLTGLLQPKLEFRLLHPCTQAVKWDPNWIIERPQVLLASTGDKVRLTTELIDAIRAQAPDDRIVVFSTQKDPLFQAHQIRNGGLYNGDISMTKRDQVLEAFRASSSGVLYCTTQTGGVGINLTCANRVIIMDASWNPGDDSQAVSRCYRMGQTKQVFVYRLIAEKTLEETIYRMNVKKQNLISRVLDEQEAVRHYSRDELVQYAAGTDDQTALDIVKLTDYDDCLVHLINYNCDVSVTNHDELFSQDSADELTDAERCEAQNDMHANAARVDALRGDDGRLVAPAALFFEASCDGRTFKRTVDFSKEGQIFATLSPTVRLVDKEKVMLLIDALLVNDLAAALDGREEHNEHDWIRVLDISDVMLRRKIDPSLAGGYYVFRSRLASLVDDEIGPCSPISAPVNLA